MRANRIVFSCFLILLIAAGCGGRKEAPAEESTDHSMATESATAPEVAREIGAIHAEVMQETVRMMEAAPDAAALLRDLTSLRDRVVPQLVGLGKKREAFGRAGRAIVDAAVNASLNRLAPDIIMAFADGQRKFSGNPELAALINRLSMVTRYANFELLRQQDPSEASRLNIP